MGLVMLTTTTSCNDWLDLKPNNEQVTADYWKSKEDVEAVIASGYYYMRNNVTMLARCTSMVTMRPRMPMRTTAWSSIDLYVYRTEPGLLAEHIER